MPAGQPTPDKPFHIPTWLLQDGPELAAALRDAAQAAAVPWPHVPAADIERALRGFEHRRSTRCAPLVAQARENGRRLTVKRTWLVRRGLPNPRRISNAPCD